MAMYERAGTPLPHWLRWVIPGVVMLGLLIWLLTWLIFFHHNTSKKTPTSPKAPTSQGQTRAPSGAGSAPSVPNGGTNATPTAPNNASNPSTSANSTPPELANTGPGDVVLPVVAATVIGGGLYYVRLRRRSVD